MGVNDGVSLGRGGTYLLTWTTYGSWLCGDERGFVSDIPDGEGGSSIRNRPGNRTISTTRRSVPQLFVTKPDAWSG
jgi:hypothetical protein